MGGFILPLIFLISSIGLFVGYINPTYQNVKDLRAQDDQYSQVLTQSTNLRKIRDQLLSRRNTFSSDDVQRLERMLPDNVDNIRLIIDIDDIAARYHMQIKDVQLAKDDTGATSIKQPSVGVGAITLSFTVTADYNSFVAFLQDLEKSLRLVDITGISFGSEGGGTTSANGGTDYKITIQTYWLR